MTLPDEQPDELLAGDAQKLVASIAVNTSNIIITDHAKERMEVRNITVTHIVNTLRRGAIVEGPYQSQQGDSSMRFRHVSAGLETSVVVAIDWPNRLIVVTVF